MQQWGSAIPKTVASIECGEDLVAIDPAPRTASCIAGARARPPEDAGGTTGYTDFLAIIADPSHPEYRKTLPWCGGRFDPEALNLDRTRRDVTAALRANRPIRRRQ
jgi:Plasmid pRiA4b ORF-3-like protein